jgi:hypothetical protein
MKNSLARNSVAVSCSIIVLMVVTSLARAGEISLTEPQRQKIIRLVQADRDASRLFQKLKALADESLDAAPHPVTQIQTAGKLQSDPDKAESRAALEDMKRLEALGYCYAITTNPAYAASARRLILGWARIEQPTGSPVDETKLEPLFVAYDLTRATFAASDKKEVDEWLRKIAQLEISAARLHSMTASNNWQSHRLKIIGLIGFLLEDQSLIDHALEGLHRQIAINLLPDGSSIDFHERDALHYHCYDLEPLLTLAIIAHQSGLDLYHKNTASGSSLAKSVQFLVPYCEGAEKHAEWVNSIVPFDQERAAAGERKFQTGSPFDPHDALRVMELASYFDPELKPLVARLNHRPSATFPTWRTALNEAKQ